MTKTKAQRHKEWLAAGICPECGTRPLHVNRKRCTVCLQKAQIKENFKRNRQHDTARRTGVSCYCEGYQPDWIETVSSKFNGRCHYTGWQIALGETASLDHVIPVKRIGSGWTSSVVNHPDNLVWCHYAVNAMKGDMTGEEFKQWLNLHLTQALAFNGGERR